MIQLPNGNWVNPSIIGSIESINSYPAVNVIDCNGNLIYAKNHESYADADKLRDLIAEKVNYALHKEGK